MFRFRTAYIISFLTGFCLLLIYAFESYYPNFMWVFANGFPPFLSGIVAFASIMALKRYWAGPGSKLAQPWICFAVGLGFWFLGELTWGIYSLVLNVDIPYPSLADAFWLIGYIPLLLALALYLLLMRPAISVKVFVVALAIVLALGAVFSTFVLIPAVTEEAETLAKLIDIAYPLLDLIMLVLSAMCFMIFAESRLETTWLLLNAGFIMFALGDSIFSYTTAQGLYYEGHSLELFFHLGDLMLALAFYIHIKSL